MPADLGFTHIALVVADMEASLAFYADYANIHVVHPRNGQGRGDVVAWISDGTRPFVLVLIQQPGLKDRPRGPIAPPGVACPLRDDLTRLASRPPEAGDRQMAVWGQ